MAAKYIVTAPPGAPVPTVGFVRVGEIFTAPAGYVPSRTMKPLNEEAVAQLNKVKADLLRRADELEKDNDKKDLDTRKADSAYAKALRADAGSIFLEAVVLPTEEPKIEAGIPLSKMANAAFSSAAQQAPGERSSDQKSSRKM